MKLMAPPRKKKPTPDDSPRRPGGVFLRLDKEHWDALDAYLASQDVAPKRAAAVAKALEEFLRQRGFWPPKPKG